MNSALAMVEYFRSIEEELIQPIARKNKEQEKILRKKLEATKTGGYQIVERVKSQLVFLRNRGVIVKYIYKECNALFESAETIFRLKNLRL